MVCKNIFKGFGLIVDIAVEKMDCIWLYNSYKLFLLSS